MQREIKFRVWDVVGDRWMEIFEVNLLDKDYLNNPEYIVQQSTDIKDHNNKEIYEGDIIDLTYSIGHERDSSQDYYGEYSVEFKNGEWKLIKTKIYDEDDYNNELSLWSEASDYQKKMGMETFEIIGNIFEDSELLEDK